MEISAIEKLCITQECTNLINLYSALNDAGEYVRLVDLFTEDGSFARPSRPDDILTGRTMILQAFQARPPRKTVHVVSNIMVTVESATAAKARSIITLYSAPPEAQIAPPPIMVGHFADEIVKQGATWLFASRRGMIDFQFGR